MKHAAVCDRRICARQLQKRCAAGTERKAGAVVVGGFVEMRKACIAEIIEKKIMIATGLAVQPSERSLVS